jgi:hypothetical protein
MSFVLLPSRHGFEPHLLHRFLTFYVDLIKLVDGWADNRFLTFYTDLIKLANGLTGWADTVSRPAYDMSGPELWPVGIWLVPGRRLAIYRRALG